MTAWTGTLLAAQKEASEAGAWSELWPLLLTAGLTLGVTVVVQLVIVPRVETRKRRDERWDQDVVRLGELLTFEQPAAANALGHEVWVKALLDDPPEDVSHEGLREMRGKHEERLKTARDEYKRITSRVDWLIERVESIDRRAEGLRSFTTAAIHCRLAQMLLDSSHYAPLDGTALATDKADELREKERRAVRALVEAVKGLAGQHPPRRSLRRRIRDWLSPVGSKVAKWRQNREVKSRTKGTGDEPEAQEQEQDVSTGG